MAPELKDTIEKDLAGEHMFFAVIFFIFIMIATFTVLNMLLGVLVNVVGAVTLMEKEQMDVSFVKRYFRVMLEEVDTDGNCHISKDEFEELLLKPGVAPALQSVGVD